MFNNNNNVITVCMYMCTVLYVCACTVHVGGGAIGVRCVPVPKSTSHFSLWLDRSATRRPIIMWDNPPMDGALPARMAAREAYRQDGSSACCEFRQGVQQLENKYSFNPD